MLKTKGRAHIGTVEVARSTKLEINVVRHDNDKDYLDVRTWFANIYAGGAWTPTKKGIHFPIDKIDALIQKLQDAKLFNPQDLVIEDAPTHDDTPTHADVPAHEDTTPSE